MHSEAYRQHGCQHKNCQITVKCRTATCKQALERTLADAAAGLDASGARAALNDFTRAASSTSPSPSALESESAAPGGPGVTRATAAAASKLQRALEAVAEGIAAAGQAQLLRRRLSFELRLLSM